MKSFLGVVIAISLILSASQVSRAEPLEYYLVDNVSYDPAITLPEDIFGHNLGDQPSRHDLMVRYMEQLNLESDRISVEVIGYSHERRPILFAVITSPENHADITAIRDRHVAAVRGGQVQDPNDPVVTWINYGVHGAEASGMDAAIPTLYHLAAATGPEIENQLKNSVILITAIFNPDGHSRRVGWGTSYMSDVVATDPAHEIHHQVWPGGRTNHYWFDLNRQWLLQTQPESRAWLTKWHEWKPHVSADFHEMFAESTYYFHPGVPTRKNPLIPAQGRALLSEIAGYHEDALDQAKELYFTEEGFDNFYIGKGSTYPQVNGGLGILFEAGGQMGLARESAQGIKTFARNIRTHMRTSLSTIRGAVAMKAKLQAYQQEFFETAQAEAEKDKVKAYVVRADEDPVRLAAFVDLMHRHEVKVYALDGSIKLDGRTFGAGSYIIPMNQPQYRMLRGLMETQTEFEDKVFYDVSGWTMPLAYGLDYGAVTQSLKGKIGTEVTVEEVAGNIPTPEEASYAYVFEWNHYYAPRALGRITGAGILARVALNPVTVATENGPLSLRRGAVIVSLDRQEVPLEDIHQMMREVALEDHIPVFSATSGKTLDPGTDLGARTSVSDMAAPRPLLVVGPGVSAYDAGEIWHLMDHKMKLPVTLVTRSRLKSVRLENYSHLILPAGRGDTLSADLVERVKTWARKGGTVVAFKGAARFIGDTVLGRTAELDEENEITVPDRVSYEDKGAHDAEHVVGGAVFESRLDITHPMAFGFVRQDVATHKSGTTILAKPKDPFAQVAVYGEEPLLSGYASPERIAQFKETPMLTAERFGAGSVILFADNPNFRATYLGAEKLFLNALFFSRSFASARLPGDEAESVEE